MKKRISFVLLIVALGIFGCDFFNNPLSEYIDNATNSAEGLRAVVTTPHYERSDGVIAIPPRGGGGGNTLVHIHLRNAQGYDLDLELEGEGEEMASAEQLPNDKAVIVVTITNPEYLDVFDLTIKMSANGRPMPSFKMPILQARYFNTDLASLVVSADGVPAVLDPPFNPLELIENYSVIFDEHTEEINIAAGLPEDVNSKIGLFRDDDVEINAPDTSLTSDSLTIGSGPNVFKIVVTADSGKPKTYTLTANKDRSSNTLIEKFEILGVSGPKVSVENPDVTELLIVSAGAGLTHNVRVTHEGASVKLDGTTKTGSPVEFDNVNFSSPKTFTVIAENGDTLDYTVTVMDSVAKVSKGINDEYYDDLKKAFDAVNPNETATITVLQDIEEQEPISISSGKKIILTNDGARKITLGENGSMFTVSDSGTQLTIQGGDQPGNTLTLQGREDNTAALINVSGGTFTLGANATITGNTNSTSNNGSGVHISSGNFTMNGGTVSATTGIAIYNASTASNAVTIANGTVSATTGIAIQSTSGLITVSGSAEVTSQNTTASRGTIFIQGINNNTDELLKITGGTVSNTANNGRAIQIINGGVANITAGNISASGSDAYAVYHGATGNIDGLLTIHTNVKPVGAIFPDAAKVKIDIGTAEVYYRSLRNAFGSVTGEATITVLSNTTVTATTANPIVIDSEKKIILTNDNNDRTITLSGNNMFRVTGGAELIIKGSSETATLFLNGGDNTTNTVSSAENGTITLADYAEIYTSPSSTTAGGVQVVSSNGTFTMNGGKVTAYLPISSNGTVSISGGIVETTRNTSSAIRNTGGSITVSGSAEIISSNNNSVSEQRGTISSTGGSVTISGGTVKNTNDNIDNNMINNGTAVHASGGSVTISGGTVESTGNSGYAVRSTSTSGAVTITGGIVRANGGGTPYAVRHESTNGLLTIHETSGTTITGNIFPDSLKVTISGSPAVTYHANLSTAFNALDDNQTATITVQRNIQNQTACIISTTSGTKTINLVSNENREIQFAIGGYIRVDTGVTLSIGGASSSPLTLRGPGLSTANSSSLVEIYGTFTLGANAKITENYKNGPNGGGVSIIGGTFHMYGTISNNKVHNSGNGVYMDNGSFFMYSSAKIHDNIESNHGGGVFIANGTFTMESAEIYNNTSGYGGGGVYIEGGAFHMRSGAKIYNNTVNMAVAGYGGGVYIATGGTFYDEGGEIYSNSPDNLVELP